MKVILEANFFAEGVRYRKGDGKTPVDIPDRLKDKLPKSAKIVSFEPPPKKQETEAERITREHKEALHANDGKSPFGAKPRDTLTLKK